jgi:hypothetical protein
MLHRSRLMRLCRAEMEQQELFARLQQAKQQLELPDMKQQPAAASSSMGSSAAADSRAEPAEEGIAARRVPREHVDSRAAAAQAASTSSSSTSSTSTTSGPRQSDVSRGVGDAGGRQSAAPPDAGQQGSAQQAEGAAGGSGQVDVLPAVRAMYSHAERTPWEDEAFEQAVNDALTMLRDSVR